MIRKRSKNKTLWKKTFRACERALIAAVNRRDRVCQFCPNIPDNCLQADHCFSRTVKILFFDIRNLTLMCSACHTKKTFKVNGFDKVVDEFVRRREGAEWWENSLALASNHKAYKHGIQELEDLKQRFDGMYLA